MRVIGDRSRHPRAQVFAVGGCDWVWTHSARGRMPGPAGVGERCRGGLGGSAEARRRAGALNPSGSSRARGTKRPNCAIRNPVRCQFRGRRALCGMAAAVRVVPRPESGPRRARLDHWTGSRCGERLSLSGAVPQESQALIPRRGSGSGTNPPAFSGGRAGKSRKPFPVVPRLDAMRTGRGRRVCARGPVCVVDNNGVQRDRGSRLAIVGTGQTGATDADGRAAGRCAGA